MPRPKARKTSFEKLGYGVLALYAAGLVGVALGVYGYNVTSLIMTQSQSEQARAQVRTGRMVISSRDRVQCRSIQFNNETAEVSAETIVDCEPQLRPRARSGSFGIFRDGFVNR